MKNTEYKSEVQRVKSTGSTVKRTPVRVQDLPTEVPANTWEWMVKELCK